MGRTGDGKRNNLLGWPKFWWSDQAANDLQRHGRPREQVVFMYQPTVSVIFFSAHSVFLTAEFKRSAMKRHM